VGVADSERAESGDVPCCCEQREVGGDFRLASDSGPPASVFAAIRTLDLIYAGDGRFRYNEDQLNMAHVIEDLGASGWRPPAGRCRG
jgi:hypothetical protein